MSVYRKYLNGGNPSPTKTPTTGTPIVKAWEPVNWKDENLDWGADNVQHFAGKAGFYKKDSLGNATSEYNDIGNAYATRYNANTKFDKFNGNFEAQNVTGHFLPKASALNNNKSATYNSILERVRGFQASSPYSSVRNTNSYSPKTSPGYMTDKIMRANYSRKNNDYDNVLSDELIQQSMVNLDPSRYRGASKRVEGTPATMWNTGNFTKGDWQKGEAVSRYKLGGLLYKK